MTERSAPKSAPGALERRVVAVVPDQWLAAFVEDEHARRLAELQGDQDLLDRLMWAGYSGPDWDRLADRLIGYGFTVMNSWIRRGLVFDRCAQYGVLLRRNPRSAGRQEAWSLAGETVVFAVVKFRQTVLVPRLWRPDGGASLETYFIRQCLIRFPNIYRRWLRESGCGGADALDSVNERRAGAQPEWELIESDARFGRPDGNIGRDALLDLSPDPLTRSILDYVAEDFTYEEIAVLLDTTESAIKSRLYRMRRAHRNYRGADGDVA